MSEQNLYVPKDHPSLKNKKQGDKICVKAYCTIGEDEDEGTELTVDRIESDTAPKPAGKPMGKKKDPIERLKDKRNYAVADMK